MMSPIYIILLSVAASACFGFPSGGLAAGSASGGAASDPGSGGVGQAVEQLTDILDIKPPELLDSGHAWLAYLLLGLAVLILAAGIYGGIVYWKKRRIKEEVSIPEEPADHRAFRLMDELAGDRVVDTKGFYFRLSAIFRGYVQARFGIDALEMTSEELLPRISELGLEGELVQGVRKYTLASEPVKFSDRSVDGEKMQSDINFIRAFVSRTTPADEGESGIVAARWEEESN